MDYKKLQSILFKSNLKVALLGLIIFLLGSAFFIEIIVDDSFQGSYIGMSFFGILIGGLGGFTLWRVLPAMIKAKTGTHPLLKAIKEGNRDYLVWVYDKRIDSTLGHGGPTVGTSNNFAYFTKDCKGKGAELVLGKKDSSEDLMNYLRNEFDIPFLGYADDTRTAVNDYFGTSGINKL